MFGILGPPYARLGMVLCDGDVERMHRGHRHRPRAARGRVPEGEGLESRYRAEGSRSRGPPRIERRSAGFELRHPRRRAEPVTGLEPYTLYHFRVVASSSAGTVGSADATFTTRKIPLSLTVTAAPNPVGFGSPLGLSGTLAGTGNTGVEIVLQANPFPYTHGFHDISSPEPTDAAGGFSFPIAGLLQSTQLRAATAAKPVIYSPVVSELVAVGVTLHVRPARRRGFVCLYGTVTPAEPGARVAFERLDREHRYVPVSGTTVRAWASGVSRFTRTVRLRRRGLYRALVQVASGAQVSGRSRPVLIR